MSNTQSTTDHTFNVPQSIYIPRIFNNITYERICQVFKSLDLATVSHVDFVPRGDNTDSKMAFIHFHSWNTANIASQHLIERINDPNREARLVYEDPYYWILLPNSSEFSTSRYNAQLMRYDIDCNASAIQNMNESIKKMKSVLDTLLADFYDIPENLTRDQDTIPVPAPRLPQSSSPNSLDTTNSSFLQTAVDQSTNQRMCKVCNVFMPLDATECPACAAPVNADEKLLAALATRPDDDTQDALEKSQQTAMNKINDFMESTSETASSQNNNNESSSSWTWFN
tara:strand:- start:2397 stop:3248 length:852 start_codon:yes stop_codon:yes gene_type:complete